MQVYLNGTQFLPGRGIDSSMLRLAILNDTFGVCNTIPGGAGLPLFGSQNHIDHYVQRVSALDYTAIPLGGRKCTTLDIEMSRSYIDGMSEEYTQAIAVQVFAEVLKSFRARQPQPPGGPNPQAN
jgi:hypothetical protein